MNLGILCALVVLGLASLCNAKSEGTFSVSLKKKPLDLHRVLQQRQTAHDRYLGGALNGGEDISLSDFMDAQAMLLLFYVCSSIACIEAIRQISLKLRWKSARRSHRTNTRGFFAVLWRGDAWHASSVL